MGISAFTHHILFQWDYTASLSAVGDATVGHNSRNKGLASVMVNGEKANTDNRLLSLSEARGPLAWPS